RTMFISNSATALKELRLLRRSSRWPRWKSALRENAVGKPVPLLIRGSTSGIQVHHTYHIAQFEEATGAAIGDMRLIFEFGGGYGSMCRQAHLLGFRGKYVIFDLPEFSALQRYFLRSIGLRVLSPDEGRDPRQSGI